MRFLILVLLTMPALAGQASDWRTHHDLASGEQACVSDYFLLCSSATDASAVKSCFLKNQASVSAPCLAVVRRFGVSAIESRYRKFRRETTP